jgi:hypothetical protein
MWYCSGTDWLKVNDKYEHTYDIKYAHSENGIEWHPRGTPSVAQRNQSEALTRPFVVQDQSQYHMWFCYRGSQSFRDGSDAYRIGHAGSADLLEWQRDDATDGLEPSPAGWDSKMVAYPAVVSLNNQMLMFYNGNNFGAAGFGLAVSPR